MVLGSVQSNVTLQLRCRTNRKAALKSRSLTPEPPFRGSDGSIVGCLGRTPILPWLWDYVAGWGTNWPARAETLTFMTAPYVGYGGAARMIRPLLLVGVRGR